jgi:DNA modification methylase
MTCRILVGDVRERLRDLPDQSVQCCVTSPPYYGLRRYLPIGHEDAGFEIGAAPLFAEVEVA